MALVEIKNSNLVSLVKHEIDKRVGGFIDDKSAVRIYKTILVSTTSFLGIVKSTKNPIALVVTDSEGNFISAGVVEYNEATDKEDDVLGNWNYFWTFSKDDIPENATVYDIHDSQTHKPIIDAAWQHTSAKFEGTEGLIATFIFGLDVLKSFLMENANEGDTYELAYPGVFVAMSTVEDGEKVVSITPDGLVKKMIKDDAALEDAKTA